MLDRRLPALGTGHDGDFVRHTAAKGDRPVGHVPTTAVAEVAGGPPVCDGEVLDSRRSRDMARAGAGRSAGP
ncbi:MULTISPECIES: hypothetical protein [unclassified Streptomyces]|uniref:hypothetical protein n=1 Tax=unclassified Streptomyces TaxID=2593676 RepID=UPI00131EB34A|nr:MULTISPECIES: hypothetical protein [unclassified Streptomyces]